MTITSCVLADHEQALAELRDELRRQASAAGAASSTPAAATTSRCRCSPHAKAALIRRS